MESSEIAVVIGQVKSRLVPLDDVVAEKRFNAGTKSLSQLLQNIVDRRLHRIPKDHPDYTPKGD